MDRKRPTELETALGAQPHLARGWDSTVGLTRRVPVRGLGGRVIVSCWVSIATRSLVLVSVDSTPRATHTPRFRHFRARLFHQFRALGFDDRRFDDEDDLHHTASKFVSPSRLVEALAALDALLARRRR